jgi:hypothetical protein
MYIISYSCGQFQKRHENIEKNIIQIMSIYFNN